MRMLGMGVQERVIISTPCALRTRSRGSRSVSADRCRANLHDRPARRKVDARTVEETLAQSLHLAYQLPFVHVAGRMILDNHSAIYNDGVHTASIGVVDQ